VWRQDWCQELEILRPSVRPGSQSCGKVTAHVRNKVALVTPGYYIGNVKLAEAHIQPVLMVPDGGFPDYILDMFAGTRLQAEWVELFGKLANIMVLDKTDQLDIIARVSRKVHIGATPMKTRARTTSLDLDSDMDAYAAAESWSVTSEDALNSATMEEETRTSESVMVEHMGTHWNTLVKGIQGQKTIARDFESDFKALLEDVDDKVLNVSAMVGTPSVDMTATTVWAALGSHDSILASYSGNLAAWSGVKTILESKIGAAQNKCTEVDDRCAVVEKFINENVLPVMQDLVSRTASVSNVAGLQISPNQEVADLKKCAAC
jgi:hypothetical protein